MVSLQKMPDRKVALHNESVHIEGLTNEPTQLLIKDDLDHISVDTTDVPQTTWPSYQSSNGHFQLITILSRYSIVLQLIAGEDDEDVWAYNEGKKWAAKVGIFLRVGGT